MYRVQSEPSFNETQLLIRLHDVKFQRSRKAHKKNVPPTRYMRTFCCEIIASRIKFRLVSVSGKAEGPTSSGLIW